MDIHTYGKFFFVQDTSVTIFVVFEYFQNQIFLNMDPQKLCSHPSPVPFFYQK